MSTPTPIHWPALIQYPGDDELEYLHDQTAWDAWKPGLSSAKLIDSNGVLYQLAPAKALTEQGKVSLAEVLNLIRAHAAQEGVCCTPKIGAVSISSAIRLLENL
ncbi:DUF4144 domain-containing protein [Methylobacillus arboreus]|uniref:DUF4144 domain-containing protein n=1 Tax=Methylobacillus arboreus TaxID=755170 RepID=UPI001E535219|nr:DUF4144 domain-containing protein [Methylobacillus arboreus]MCB5191530.1 DUF4144 domain-containing protein [Methylobacillus arboreus]